MVRFSRGRLVVLRMCYPQGIASVPYRHNMGVTPGNCKRLVKDQGPPPLNSVECGRFFLGWSTANTATSITARRIPTSRPDSGNGACRGLSQRGTPSDSSRRMDPSPNTFDQEGICFLRRYTVKK